MLKNPNRESRRAGAGPGAGGISWDESNLEVRAPRQDGGDSRVVIRRWGCDAPSQSHRGDGGDVKDRDLQCKAPPGAPGGLVAL